MFFWIPISLVGLVVLFVLWRLTFISSPSPVPNPNSEVKQSSQADNKISPETTGKKGLYTDYRDDLISRAKDSKVVLFFYAAWCPTCKILNDNLNQNVDSIPENITILKVDYDTALDLKRKYGVTYQHTLVQVNEKGDLLKKWSGSYLLSEIVNQII